MRKVIVLVIILSVFGFANEVVRLRKVKVMTEEYKVLTKKNPIAITAEGPANLKIETHILYPDTLFGKGEEEKYSLVLETEEGEKFFSFKTPLSRIRDEKGRRYGQKRVVNFSLLPGTHHFRLHLFSSSKDTCAVKIALEKMKWEEIKPTLCKSEVLIKKNGNLRYYETPVRINLKGGEYKFLFRLFSSAGEEEETLAVSLKKNGEEKGIEKKFLVSLSPKVKTANQEAVSQVKALYLQLAEGNYQIEVKGKRGMVKVYEKK